MRAGDQKNIILLQWPNATRARGRCMGLAAVLYRAVVISIVSSSSIVHSEPYDYAISRTRARTVCIRIYNRYVDLDRHVI